MNNNTRRLPFRRPTASTPATSPLSTPHSIRSSSELLAIWDRLSMHVHYVILMQPTVGQLLINRFTDVLDTIDTLTQGPDDRRDDE